MGKYFLVIGAIVTATAIAFFAFQANKTLGVKDYKNASYVIQGKTVTLTQGLSEVEDTPHSKTVTQYFGNEAKGDLNDDGIPDIAFILTQNGGGSGTFVYVVVAFQNKAGQYEGSNGILLGDRVAPQSTEIRNGILIVNYADRKPEESFSTPPSVGVSVYVYFDGEKLVSVPPTGPIAISGTLVCLPHTNTEGPQTLECAQGLRDDLGRYFALHDTDPEYTNISGAATNSRVRVTGIFKLQLQSNYADIGIIEITSLMNE